MDNDLVNDSVCRVCLEIRDNMIFIFDIVNDMDSNLSELLEEYGDISVKTTDDLPKYLCQTCTNELLITVKFRIKCRNSVKICESAESQLINELEEIVQNKELQHSTKDVSVYCENENDIENEQITDELKPTNDQTTAPAEDIVDEIVLEHKIETIQVQNKNEEEDDLIGILKFKCDMCGAAFKNIVNLHRHIYSHGIEKIYECYICKQAFGVFENLQNHKGQHLLDCQENDLQENLPENISLINQVTIDGNPNANLKKAIPCGYCGKDFNCHSALNNHIRIHTGVRPFSCKKCEKSFKTQGGLALHSKRHLGIRPFQCSECGKSFSEASNLKVHKRIHTGEKPHSCKICGKCFLRVYQLQLHIRTHTGEKPYTCEYCERGFAQLSDMQNHRRTHTGDKPHLCIYCNKRFIKLSALNIHMKAHNLQGILCTSESG